LSDVVIAGLIHKLGLDRISCANHFFKTVSLFFCFVLMQYKKENCLSV